jgi:putative phosphoribosyl transferase
MPSFANRTSAGQALAAAIAKKYPEWLNQSDTLILGLPRGGMPVASAVAKTLGAPLDAYIVRKIGVPGQEELAMGAIAMDGSYFLDHTLIKWLHIETSEIDASLAREQKELERRASLYRGSAEAPLVEGKKVLLVDDGLATGATMRAAVHAIKKQHPAALMIAVPVAPPSTIKELSPEVDHILCLEEHEPFIGVGLWYRDFTQTTDREVEELLASSKAPIRFQKDRQAGSRPTALQAKV